MDPNQHDKKKRETQQELVRDQHDAVNSSQEIRSANEQAKEEPNFSLTLVDDGVLYCNTRQVPYPDIDQIRTSNNPIFDRVETDRFHWKPTNG